MLVRLRTILVPCVADAHAVHPQYLLVIQQALLELLHMCMVQRRAL
jgi:hypothetical protein